MKTKKLWYIKERRNTQFKKPYYSGLGQLSKKLAKGHENTLYGINVILPYESEESYNAALKSFDEQGFNVY